MLYTSPPKMTALFPFGEQSRLSLAYHYDLYMVRRGAPMGAPVGAKACAETPKGFTQCI
jgi:hypothetical protein